MPIAKSDQLMHSLFEYQTNVSPEKVAVRSSEGALTYQDLDQRAEAFARYLKDKGVGPDVLVALMLERSCDMLVALLGVLKAGGAYIPLDPDYPRDRIGYMLDHSQAPFLVTQLTLLNVVPETNARVICFDADWPDLEPLPAPGAPLSSDHLAYVIYTSGSTGKPKGVQITHGGVANFLSSMLETPGMRSEDVLLAVTTLSFDIAVLELFLPLCCGATTVIADRSVATDGELMKQALLGFGVTVMQATPSTWRNLLNAGWRGNGSFKVLCGGEAFPPDLANQLLGCAGEVWNMYGPTETTIWSTCYRLTKKNQPVLIGRPIANTQVFVLDRSHNPVPVGLIGDIYIGGHGLARGYLYADELTQAAFIRHPFSQDPSARLYKTGDEGRFLPDKNLEYKNRADHQIKIRGYRVELGEIEAALSDFDSISQAAVLLREDKPEAKRLVAYLIAEDGSSVNTMDVRRHLSNVLPHYMIPQNYMVMARFPLTPNGKIDRKSFPAPIGEVAEIDADELDLPETPAEIYLAEWWKKLLNVPYVEKDDNFFELGGHSLLSMEVIVGVRKETGVRISTKAMLMATLEDIASAELNIDIDELLHLRIESPA